MKHATPSMSNQASLAVMGMFRNLSKEELIAALSFLHRILDADKPSDLDTLLRELPELLAVSRPPSRDDGGVRAKTGPGDGRHRLLRYCVSCLSKAQARIPVLSSGQVRPAIFCGRLTPRELSVLRWMKEGKTNWEIAGILGLSERTVRFHVGGIFEKLKVHTRTQAVARALGAGLIVS